MNEREPSRARDPELTWEVRGDEDLLELALAAARGDAGAREHLAALALEAPDQAARAAELALFAGHLRERITALERAAIQLARAPGAQGSAAPPRERALVQRVLARTTREDLSRWGDLGLAARFVATRLRASGALRLAAASLILHLLALPVVAWYVWNAPEAPQRIWFAPPFVPALPYGEPAAEPDLALEAPAAIDEARDLERGMLPEAAPGSDYVLNSIRWARWMVGSAAGPVPAPVEPGRDEGEPARLVRLRAALLFGEGSSRPALPEGELDALARVLWAELLLDELLLAGSAPPGLADSLLALLPGDASSLSGAHAPPPAGTPTEAAALRLLAACALARAEAYGVLPAACAPELEAARRELPAGERLLERGSEAWLVAPFDGEWRRLLLQAAGPRSAPGLARALGE